jgi:hypothetical protein
MALSSVKRRLHRLRRTHLTAKEFLLWLDSVNGLFDPKNPPTWGDGLSEQCWKSLSYLLHLCCDWQDRDDPFPREFSKSESAPVECFGEIETAHWLAWILSQRVLHAICAAIESPRNRREELDLSNRLQSAPSTVVALYTEEVYENADWSAISKALSFGNADIRRLDARLTQEYQHAVNLIKSQLSSDGSKEKPTATAAGKPCRHGPDFRSVHWHGNDYSFTPNQAACVRILWAAWVNDTPEVSGSHVLEEADISGDRLDQVFRGHPAWGPMIGVGTTKGAYRLQEPAKG